MHEAAEAAADDPGSQSDFIRDYYAALPTMPSAQRSVASLLRTVATGPGGVLVHCAAGKDRTGWAIAAVLTAAGADREAVTADYLLSNAAIESLRDWLRIQYPDVYDNPTAILGVQERFLHAAFDSVDSGLRFLRRLPGRHRRPARPGPAVARQAVGLSSATATSPYARGTSQPAWLASVRPRFSRHS